jgi:hypothetical protein
MHYRVGMDAQIIVHSFYELDADNPAAAIAKARQLWSQYVRNLELPETMEMPDTSTVSANIDQHTKGEAWLEFWDGDNVETVPESELVDNDNDGGEWWDPVRIGKGGMQ